MSTSDKYLALFYKCLGNTESTFTRKQLKSIYLKKPVSLVQYRGAVGNFNKLKIFNTNAKNKVFGHRYWIPTNSGTVIYFYQ